MSLNLTTTDYIGIGVLISTFFSGLTTLVTQWKVKEVHSLVNGNAAAQATLIAKLQENITDKNYQLAEQKQVAAVLATTNGEKKQ